MRRRVYRGTNRTIDGKNTVSLGRLSPAPPDSFTALLGRPVPQAQSAFRGGQPNSGVPLPTNPSPLPIFGTTFVNLVIAPPSSRLSAASTRRRFRSESS